MGVFPSRLHRSAVPCVHLTLASSEFFRVFTPQAPWMGRAGPRNGCPEGSTHGNIEWVFGRERKRKGSRGWRLPPLPISMFGSALMQILRFRFLSTSFSLFKLVPAGVGMRRRILSCNSNAGEGFWSFVHIPAEPCSGHRLLKGFAHRSKPAVNRYSIPRLRSRTGSEGLEGQVRGCCRLAVVTLASLTLGLNPETKLLFTSANDTYVSFVFQAGWSREEACSRQQMMRMH